MPAKAKLPTRLEPMLATPLPAPPTGDGWAYEIKWDGIRALAYLDGERLKLSARRGADHTPRYPELAELAEALDRRDAILDGEIVAFDDEGRPRFQLLQRRMGLVDRGDDPPPGGRDARDLRRLRRALARRRAADRATVRAPARAARRARARRSTTGGRRATTSATAPRSGTWSRIATSRGSSRSGSARRTGPASAAASGRRSATAAVRSS